jgi:uncharacterized membrane protein YdbT with pleckstrin-like domain
MYRAERKVPFMRVKSSIDLLFGWVFWITVAVIGVSVLLIPEGGRIPGLVVSIPVLGLLLWIYCRTYYELREEYLYCRSGPFFEKIPYDRIKSVKLCENLFSSMALSSKRIEICQHDRGFITGTTYISPVNREEFLEELKRRCTNLEE